MGPFGYFFAKDCLPHLIVRSPSINVLLETKSFRYPGNSICISNNRTGKRGVLGLLKDGINASHRYFVNNFIDGWRQVKGPEFPFSVCFLHYEAFVRSNN